MNSEKYRVTKLPAYRAIGMKWDGAYSEIASLKEIIGEMKSRAKELERIVQPNIQLGLSYHLRPDGFVHYSAFKVTEEQSIPEGMIEIRIPEFTYVTTHHPKGHDTIQTYLDLKEWLRGSDYEAYYEKDVQYYEDGLPIKHEQYPLDQDPNDPHFDIFIPVTKK